KKQLIVNDKPVRETYVSYEEGGFADFGPERVPEGKVLLLGDNRDNSRDARFWPKPFISQDRIIGKAKLVYWNSREPSERVGLSLE
ncbi:MAG: signal peptidase I, partial [Cyanobacteria bacterium P01_H01_bin.15]